MSRRDEIRARLGAVWDETGEFAEALEYDPRVFVDDGWDPALAAALADAIPDLAWALGEIERLEAGGTCGATNGARRCALDAGHDGPCVSRDGAQWFSVAQVYR